MTKIKKSHISSKNTLLIGVGLATVIVGGFFYLKSLDRNASVIGNKPASEGLINLNGPTELEKNSGDNAKTTVIEQEQKRNDTPTTTESGKRGVTPTITYAGQYDQQIEVGGFVTGVFEDGGICTLTLQKDSYKKMTQVTSVKGASSVDCPVMIIPHSTLETGTYQATIAYTSSTSEGQSTARVVEVK